MSDSAVEPAAALSSALTLLTDRRLESALLDGSLAELAVRLDMVDALAAVVNGLASVLADDVAERMEHDRVAVTGVGFLEREPRLSVSWDHAAARSAARAHLLDRLSVDRFTGEVRDDWRLVAEDAWMFVTRTFSLGAPKRVLWEELGADVDEYRAVTRVGWKVRIIHPEESL